jgi:hypothetical protein
MTICARNDKTGDFPLFAKPSKVIQQSFFDQGLAGVKTDAGKCEMGTWKD